MAKSKWRGNDIEYDESIDKWVYCADKTAIPDSLYEYPCGFCGKKPTAEGHDACLGTLIGVMNACCGHGNTEEAYVQFLDGECIRGKDAKIILEVLKKYRKESNQ